MKYIINTLRKDFVEALSHIDFTKEYDPYSKEFMKPLFIGQLYLAVKSISDVEDVKDELKGAEMYTERYIATGDETFREMAKDELKHAENLMKKNSVSLSSDELEEFEEVHHELSKVIERSRG